MRRDERGAVFASFVVVLGSVLLLASLVIDVGADRIVRRDMQSVADVVALDVARQLDGRQRSAYPTSRFENAKNQSLARNQSTLNDIAPGDVTWELMVADDDGAAPFTPPRVAGASEIPNAVRVNARGTAGFRLLPSTPQSAPARRATAVLLPPAACISVETAAATLSPTEQTLLGRLLNGLIDPTRTNLAVLSPAGVAALHSGIPLTDLAAQLGVSSVEQLADARVSAGQVLAAAATVLSRRGSTTAAQVLGAAQASLNASGTFRLGDILAVVTGQGAGTGLQVDALSLLTSTLAIANGQNAIRLDTGIAGLATTVKIVEPPQIACGPSGTAARSAQVEIKLTGKLPPSGNLTSRVAQIDLKDGITVRVARGTATMGRMLCPSTGLGRLTVNVSTGVASVSTPSPVVLSLLSLLGIPIGTAEVDLGTSSTLVAGRAGTLGFEFPVGSTPPYASKSLVGTAPSLGSLTAQADVKAKLLGLITLPLAELLGIVNTALDATDALLTPVLDSLLPALGVEAGSTRVTPLTDVVCNQPSLYE